MRRTTALATISLILSGALLTSCGENDAADSAAALPSPSPTQLSLTQARKSGDVLRPVRAALDAWQDVAFRTDAPTEAWERLEAADAELGEAIKLVPGRLAYPMGTMLRQITGVLEKRWTGGEVKPAEFHAAVEDFKQTIDNPTAFSGYTDAYSAWLSKQQRATKEAKQPAPSRGDEPSKRSDSNEVNSNEELYNDLERVSESGNIQGLIKTQRDICKSLAAQGYETGC